MEEVPISPVNPKCNTVSAFGMHGAEGCRLSGNAD